MSLDNKKLIDEAFITPDIFPVSNNQLYKNESNENMSAFRQLLLGIIRWSNSINFNFLHGNNYATDGTYKDLCSDLLGQASRFISTHLWLIGCVHTHREMFHHTCQTKPKSDCIYNFPIDLEPNGRRFSFKSIGTW